MASKSVSVSPTESELDQLALSFTPCPDAPVQMSSAVAILIKDKVYYGGGIPEVDEFGDTDTDDDTYSEEERMVDNKYYVQCLELAKNKWSTLPKLPMELFGLGEVKGQLVTVGGEIETGVDGDSDADSTYHANINELYTYDEDSKSWKQTVPPMPTARESPVVISLSVHLIVAGGRAEGVALDVVEIYNHDTNQWSTTDRLPHPRTISTGVVCNNTVYLMGGTGRMLTLNTVVTAQVNKLVSHSVPTDREDEASGKYSHQHSAWQAIANTPCYNPTAAVTSDLVIAIGGVDIKEHKSIRSVYAYSSSKDSWVYVGVVPSPISYPATVSLTGTEFLMIGGGDDNGDGLSTVYRVSP